MSSANLLLPIQVSITPVIPRFLVVLQIWWTILSKAWWQRRTPVLTPLLITRTVAMVFTWQVIITPLTILQISMSSITSEQLKTMFSTRHHSSRILSSRIGRMRAMGLTILNLLQALPPTISLISRKICTFSSSFCFPCKVSTRLHVCS